MVILAEHSDGSFVFRFASANEIREQLDELNKKKKSDALNKKKKLKNIQRGKIHNFEVMSYTLD